MLPTFAAAATAVQLQSKALLLLLQPQEDKFVTIIIMKYQCQVQQLQVFTSGTKGIIPR